MFQLNSVVNYARLLGEPCGGIMLANHYKKSSELPGDLGLDFKSEGAAIYILVRDS